MDIVIDIITMLIAVVILILMLVKTVDVTPTDHSPHKMRPKRKARIVIKTEADEKLIEEKKEAEKGWN